MDFLFENKVLAIDNNPCEELGFKRPLPKTQDYPSFDEMLALTASD